jgi:hypothetical protein
MGNALVSTAAPDLKIYLVRISAGEGKNFCEQWSILPRTLRKGEKYLCLKFTRVKIKSARRRFTITYPQERKEGALPASIFSVTATMKHDQMITHGSRGSPSGLLTLQHALRPVLEKKEATIADSLRSFTSNGKKEPSACEAWVWFATKIIAEQIPRDRHHAKEEVIGCDGLPLEKLGYHACSGISPTSKHQQEDLKDGDESSFAGKRFYFVGSELGSYLPEEPTPLKESIAVPLVSLIVSLS